MANIQKRTGKNGTRYRAQVRVRGHPPQTATFQRKTDAEEWAKATEVAIAEGRHFPQREAKRHTFGAAVDRYLKAIEIDRPHAHDKQSQILGWWKVRLGDYALSRISPALITAELDKLLAENIGTEEAPRHRTGSTANRYYAAISKLLETAKLEWQWLTDNPARRVKKKSEAPGRIRYLSDDERKALLKACDASKLPELHLVVLLALTTGMRLGEILGLQWPDVDLQRRQAVLHKTKNRERRTVPLVPVVADLLTKHGKVRRLDTDLVFAQPPQPNAEREPSGQRPEAKPIWVHHWFDIALDEAKIENFRFHDLRHTAASYLAMSGATPPEIAAVLGHKTLQMVKRYAHLSDAHTSTVVERMTNKYFKDGG